MSGLNWHDAVSAWAAIVTYPSEGWALAPDMSGAAGDQDRHARGGPLILRNCSGVRPSQYGAE